MKVFRISKTRYANDLSGEGARLNGGRWNHKMTACIYASQSIALAVLEFSVNVNVEDIPRALSITTYETGDAAIDEIKISELPGDWLQFPAPSSTKNFGNTLIEKNKFPIFKIPSAVIPDEFNFIFNPQHPEFKKIKIISVRDFVYDIRIKNS